MSSDATARATALDDGIVQAIMKKIDDILHRGILQMPMPVIRSDHQRNDRSELDDQHNDPS